MLSFVDKEDKDVYIYNKWKTPSASNGLALSFLRINMHHSFSSSLSLQAFVCSNAKTQEIRERKSLFEAFKSIWLLF